MPQPGAAVDAAPKGSITVLQNTTNSLVALKVQNDGELKICTDLIHNMDISRHLSPLLTLASAGPVPPNPGQVCIPARHGEKSL
jgi:hypothetical protein